MVLATWVGPSRVSKSGAATGSVLCGAGMNNQGLRLQVLQQQAKGDGGPVKGQFLILDVGDNKHSQALRPLLHRLTDAEEVLRGIRRDYPACVNVVNACILTVEPAVPGPTPGSRMANAAAAR